MHPFIHNMTNSNHFDSYVFELRSIIPQLYGVRIIYNYIAIRGTRMAISQSELDYDRLSTIYIVE